METIGDRVRVVRKEAGLKQKDFADTVHINPNYPSQIERGHRAPGPRLIDDICTHFKVNKAWLVDGQEPMHPEPKPGNLADQLIVRESQAISNHRSRGVDAFKLDLDKIFKKYPQLKYALLFAGDENDAELNRIVLKWSEEIKLLGEQPGASKAKKSNL